MPDHGAGPATMPAENEQQLIALRGQIDAISPPHAGQVDAMVAVFETLKAGEAGITDSLRHYPDHPALTGCKAGLHRLLGRFAGLLQASNSAGMIGQRVSLDPGQIQAICQGLAVCLPYSGSLLLRDDHESCTTLQSLTNNLLAQAMASGLTDVAQANGELLDVLNWLSRGLKAGLLTAGIPIRQCFEHSLLTIHDWTGGNQSRGLLTDHNLGRCAVQISTAICLVGIDFAAPFRPGVAGATETSAQSQQAVLTNGQQLQRCALQLCTPAVIERLTRTPADITALLNISNMVKYAIEKHLIAAHDPLLMPALAKLVETIGTLTDAELVGSRADCRPLANFSNLLRLLYEQKELRHEAMAEPFPGLALSCSRLVNCIDSVAFEESHPGSQALSNLISFVKLCAKKLERCTAAVVDARSTDSTATTSSTTAPPLGQDMLHKAARRLVAGVLRYGAASYPGAPAIAGLLTGLLYLCRRNLVARSPDLCLLVKRLWARIGQIDAGALGTRERKTMLPVLKGLLQFDMVTIDDAQTALSRLLPVTGNGAAHRTLREVVAEIARLGIVDEVVIPLPLAIHFPVAATVPPTSIRGRPSSPPGWTPIVEKPVASSTPLMAESPAYGSRNIKADNPAWREVDSRKRIASSLSTAKPSLVSARQNTGALIAGAQNVDAGIVSLSMSQGIFPQQTGVEKKAAEPVRANGLETHALNGSKKKKNTKQPVKKNAAAKSGERTGDKSAKDRHAHLRQAILTGKVKDVKQLFRQKPNWLNNEIHDVLDAVIKEIDLIDTPVLNGLDTFFTVIKETGQATGIAHLANYFKSHGYVFAGLKTLAERHGLIADTVEQARRTPTGDCAPSYRKYDQTAIISVKKTAVTDGKDGNDGNDESSVHQIEIPLDDAFYRSNGVQVSTMIDGVASVFDVRPDNENAIAFAAQEGDIAEVRHLLEVQSPLVHVTHGFTPLMLAARRRHMNIVRLLLKSQPLLKQLAAKDKTGRNALMWSAASGSEQAVELLLAAGVGSKQTTDVDNDGWNALFFAALEGHVGILRRLLNADHDGKQLSLKTPEGTNAMMIAAHNGHDAVVSALLATPSGEEQLAHADPVGTNAMLMAVHGANENVIKLLLTTRTAREQAGAVNVAGMNALTLAAAFGHTALVRLFLDTEFADELANPAHAGRPNALMMAAQNGYTEIVELLLEMKSGDEQRKQVLSDGRNASMLAADHGHEDIVRLLRSNRHGYDESAVVDKNGMNALDHATKKNHLAIVELPENVALPATPETVAADPAAHEKAAI